MGQLAGKLAFVAGGVGVHAGDARAAAVGAGGVLQQGDGGFFQHLDYISYAYGIERDTIKLQAVYDDAGNYRGQVFAFQNTEQGQDKSHIHPWVVPLWTLEVPSQDPSIDPELRFARELAGLAKRMGISQRIIRIRDGYFEVPHGDHSHNIRIRNVEGSKAYMC